MVTRRMGKTIAQRIVDDNELSVRDRLYGMERIRWNDSDKARPQALGDARDRQFQFAFEDFVDLFLGMGMLMDRRAGIEFVMGERHVGGIEIAASPAGKTFDRWQLGGIDEGHPTIIR